MTTDAALKHYIQKQTDNALRGIKPFKSFKLLKGDLIKSRSDTISSWVLQYNTDRDQFVYLVNEHSSRAKNNCCLNDFDDIAPNFKDYAFWLQEELYNITIDNREKHQLLLVDEHAVIKHILAQITIQIAEICQDTSYIKASDQTHQQAMQAKRQKVIDTISAQKQLPRDIAHAIIPYFQPEEEKNLVQVASKTIPLTDEQKEWVDKKLATGQQNQKKPLINFFHAIMQPISLSLVLASTFFTPVWRFALANYLACITFFTPNPLKPIQYRILNRERQLDRRIVLILMFITLFVSSWAILQFIPSINTLSAIKAVAAIGIGCIAIQKVLATTREVLQKNTSFWHKAAIIAAEYLINGLALACITMTFMGPQYTIFSEVLFAWYSVDLCLGTINLIPSMTDKHTSKTLWTSLTFASVAYIAALATGQITLMELYIAVAVTFAAITRIASTYNIEPVITHTCARHASYLWLCWLTLENRLPILPTRIGLIINLAVEVLCACYDAWKNKKYGFILDRKMGKLDTIKFDSDNAERALSMQAGPSGWYANANTDVTGDDVNLDPAFIANIDYTYGEENSDDDMDTISLGSTPDLFDTNSYDSDLDAERNNGSMPHASDNSITL